MSVREKTAKPVQTAMLQEHPQGVSRKVYGHRKQGDWGCENGLGAFYFY